MSGLGSAVPAKSHRRLRIVVGTMAAAAVEVFVYRAYLAGDGSFHWFTHFFAGASVALVVMTLVTLRTRRPVPLPLLWPVLGHLAAMGPDLMFVNEMAHRRWMDVFIAHNLSHFIPGRNLTWYVIFLASLALFLLALPRPDQAGRGAAHELRQRDRSPSTSSWSVAPGRVGGERLRWHGAPRETSPESRSYRRGGQLLDPANGDDREAQVGPRPG